MSVLALRPGFPGDPFKQYGSRLSEFIMGTIGEVPIHARQVALEALLEELEPGLFATVTDRANRYKRAGLRTKAAVQAALASSLSQTLAEQIRDVARGVHPAVQSLSGLGTYPESEAFVLAGLRHSLGICGPGCIARKAKKAAKKVGRGIKKAGKKVGSTTKKVGKKIGSTAKKVGKKVGKTAYRWGKKVVKAAKKLHCKVAQSKASEIAAGAVAAYYGVPPKAGVAAHKAVNSKVCGGADDAAAAASVLDTPGGLLADAHANAARPARWAVPVAIGGVAAVGYFLFWRNR